MTSKQFVIIIASALVFVVLGSLCLTYALRGLKNKETIPLSQTTTFYIQSTQYEITPYFTKYLVSYTINTEKGKPTTALFVSEKEKFAFLSLLASEGTIIWLCDM